MQLKPVLGPVQLIFYSVGVIVGAIASIAFLLVHFEWRIYAAGAIALTAGAVAFAARQWSRSRER